VVNHRHTYEMEQELGLLAGDKVTVNFTPVYVPTIRGILDVCHTHYINRVTRDEVLAAVKRGGASSVRLVPFLLVAGEHVNTDILGDGPESWKSRLLAQGTSRVEGWRQGLGYNDDIINIYLDHLQEIGL
jgi:cobalamin biosynthesis Co2+ chelatase CbiK